MDRRRGGGVSVEALGMRDFPKRHFDVRDPMDYDSD